MRAYDIERKRWNTEVDTEAARLVRGGTPPYEAARQAASVVSLRRRIARDAEQADQHADRA